MKEKDIIEECTRELREDFINACQDQLGQLEKNLNTLRPGGVKKLKKQDIDNVMNDIRRITHSMKGTAQMFNFKATSIISHRLEDYLSNIISPTTDQIADIFIFSDRIQDSLAQGETAPVAEMVRKLPAYRPADNAENASKANIDKMRAKNKDSVLEAILIMPGEKLQKKIIGYELAACGFRITHATTSIEAIEMALHIKPDLILSNQVIDDLISGVELAQFFSLLESTQKTPFILLTSFSRESNELKNLPSSVKIARKNEHFMDDLAKDLLDFNFLPQWMTM